MPEGHTIHRAADTLHALFAGVRIAADSPQGRFEEGAAELDGRVLLGAEAWGKHLLLAFEHGPFAHVHLGLYGKIRTGRGALDAPRPTVRLRLRSDVAWATITGAAICELLDTQGRRALLRRLGPDPLRPEARPARALARIAKSSAPIGGLLMDQSVIAGIGNVYRAELLFRARVWPFAPGKRVEASDVRTLWRDARVLLRDGVRTGRIITTRPSDRPSPRYVYHRAGRPCIICGTTIERGSIAQRRVDWCPECQPESASTPSARDRR